MPFKRLIANKPARFIQQVLMISVTGICLSSSINPFPVISASLAPTKALPEPQVTPEQLKLTPSQKEKIAAIRSDGIKQLKEVLTPTQRVKYNEGIKKNQKLGNVLNSLNLTTDQKNKIKTIVQKSGGKVKAVLTPEQIKMLQKNKPS